MSSLKHKSPHVNPIVNNLVSANKLVTTDKVESPDMTKISMWHARSGHFHPKEMHKMLNLCKVFVNNNEHFIFCNSYCLHKAQKLYAPLLNTKKTTLFDLVHTYLWGPSPAPSSSGYSYYIAFLCLFQVHLDILIETQEW